MTTIHFFEHELHESHEWLESTINKSDLLYLLRIPLFVRLVEFVFVIINTIVFIYITFTNSISKISVELPDIPCVPRLP